MKSTLKQITESTMKELLQNDITLPSSYFKCFSKNVKEYKFKLSTEEMKHQSTNLILEEFTTINEYMNSTLSSINKLNQVSKNAKIAIINKDNNALDHLQYDLKEVEQELKNLQDEIYQDNLSKCYNRKWIYKFLLNKDAEFKETGTAVLIHLYDYNAITNKFNAILADNLLLFILSALNTFLNEEEIECVNIRFYQDTFLLMCKQENLVSLNQSFDKIQGEIFSSKLKSKTGIVLQPRFTYSSVNYTKNESFQDILEILHNELK